MRIGYEAKRIYHNSSGLGNYSRNLLRSLATYFPKNNYILYNPKQGKIPFGQEFSQIQEARPSFQNPIYSHLWRQQLLSKRAKKDKIDIFHGLSQELPTGLKKNNIPSVVSIHDLIFLQKPELYKPIDRKIYTQKVKAACAQATSIVAISKQTKTDLVNLLHIPSHKIEVIYQSCDNLFWETSTEKEIDNTLTKYNLPKAFMLFVGTLEKRKNIDCIIAAAKKLEIPTVLVGRKTAYAKNLLNKIPSFIYTPTIQSNVELAHVYKAAKLFIYPSFYEGFGIPVLEALASKTPVISSTTSSLPEVAGPSSVLVNPNKQEDINEAVAHIWNNTAQQSSMIERGYTFAQQFKEENIAKQWQALYQNLV